MTHPYADLMQAATAARVVYCAAVLAHQAGPMLPTLSIVGWFWGGKKGGQPHDAAERGDGSKGGSAAAACSQPFSRTSSAAALEAASTGSGGGKAGTSLSTSLSALCELGP